jgi:hypothetical protein
MEIRNTYKILARKHEGKEHSGSLGVEWSTILKPILEKKVERVLTGFMWRKAETSGGLFEHGIEPLTSMKGGEFLD